MADGLTMIRAVATALVVSACATTTPYLAVDPNPSPQALDFQALMAAPAKPVTDVRQRIVQTAKGHLGAPAQHGGDTPKGLDCTGFMFVVYQQAAQITLPRTSHDQVQIGKAISPIDLRPGDLVYFTVPKSRSFHVGLYVGEGRFIHAPSTTTAIRIDSLGDASWRTRFLGARQILPG